MSFSRFVANLPVVKHIIRTQQDVAEMKNMNKRLMMEDFVMRHLHQNEKYADPKRLNRFEHQVFSQSGEDGIIEEIFRRIGTKNTFFVEFGVGNGTENNTLKLLVEGWKGLWIECSARSLRHIRMANAKFLREQTLILKEATVTAESIEPLLKECAVPSEPDLLCIDIDGNDYWVWKAITAYKPRVVVIEYNALYRPPMRWVKSYDAAGSWKHTTYYGASLSSLAALGEEKGYALVACGFAGINAFFVRKDLLGDKFQAACTAENHYEPFRPHVIGDASPYPIDIGEFERL